MFAFAILIEDKKKKMHTSIIQPTNTSKVYIDPQLGIRGYLSFSGSNHNLSAGGLRIQKGLTADKIERLSQLMLLKQQLIGLAVNGAKCGLNLDPVSPNRALALKGFLNFLKPYIEKGFSVGGDLNTSFSEIDGIANELGISSIKNAIANQQGLTEKEFKKRIDLLNVNQGGLSLGQRRAGHATAQAVLSVLKNQKIPIANAKIGLQGFGTMGRATALSLWEHGLKVKTITDKSGSLTNNAGFEIPGLLRRATPGVELEHLKIRGDSFDIPTSLFEQELDILVLAAIEDAIPGDFSQKLKAKAVLVAANLGLSEAAEKILNKRGIMVIPDFVGGCGGSASMEALFGPATMPTPEKFLQNIAFIIEGIMDTLYDKTHNQSLNMKQAALQLCRENEQMLTASSKPYGKWKL